MMRRWARIARSCARRVGMPTVMVMAATIGVLLAPVAAEADTFLWKGVGGEGNWDDPNQWERTQGGSTREFPNAPGDVAEFIGPYAESVTVNIPANTRITVGAVKFEFDKNPAVPPGNPPVDVHLDIVGADETSTLILDNEPADSIAVTFEGTAVADLFVRTVLHGALLVNVHAGASATFGPIEENGGARAITKTGPGEMHLFDVISHTGTTTVAEGLLSLSIAAPGLAGDLVIGDGIGARRSATARLDFDNQLADAGQVSIKADGLLAFSNIFAALVERIGGLTVTDGVVEVNGGVNKRLIMQSLSMTGGLLETTTAAAFQIEGAITATASNAGPAVVRSTLGGRLDLLGATRTFTIEDGPGGVDLDLAIPVVGTDGAGLIKEGPGTLRFSGNLANTYPGATLVRQGRMELARAGNIAVPDGGLVIGLAAMPAEVVLLASHNIADAAVVSIDELGVLAGAEQVDVIRRLAVGAGGRVFLGGNTAGARGSLTVSDLWMTGGEIRFTQASVLVLRGDVLAGSSPIQSAVLTGDGVIDLEGADHVFAVNDGQRLIDLRIDVRITGLAPEGLIKRFNGTALFTGINNYTGPTRIEGGTLLITGMHTTSAITVAGGTLGGTGTVGPVQAPLGRVAPGTGPGRLTAGQVTFAAAATFDVELNGTRAGLDYDVLDITGPVTLGNAALAITVGEGFVPARGASFTIITNDGADPVTGTFAELAEGASLRIASRDFTISYRGGDGNDVVLTDKSDPEGPPPAPTPTELTYYLAEGATGEFFDEDVLIANPNDTAAPVTLTFLLQGGATITEPRTIPPRTRLTIHVEDIEGLEGAAASLRVVSTDRLPLIVERSMFWDETYYGGHTATAVAKPETRWTFAEGSQGSFFDTFILIANANDTATTVTLTFLREKDTPVVKTVSVGPFARETVWAGEYGELVGHAFGVVVDATQPVIAERALYFATLPGRRWTGGHVNTGIAAPSTSWFHAEGATGTFFSTFILLSNPQDTPAQIELRFLLDTGAVITLKKTIPAHQRLTINPAAEGDARLENAALSTVVQSDVPIVSERSMYWPGLATPIGEGHNSAGVTSTALRWGLAEGRLGGPHQFDTFILLANPSTTAAEVTVSYLRESGAPIVKTYTVPATSRFNVDVKTVVPELLESSFGARIEVTNDVPIVVERSLYWTVHKMQWEGGSNALAIPLP